MDELIKYKNEITSYVWERYFNKLKQFVHDNEGAVKIPCNAEYKGLAKWMERQKISQSLSTKQQARIINLGYSLVKEKT